MHGNKAELFRMMKTPFHQLCRKKGQVMVACNHCSVLFLWSGVLSAYCIYEVEANTMCYEMFSCESRGVLK